MLRVSREPPGATAKLTATNIAADKPAQPNLDSDNVTSELACTDADLDGRPTLSMAFRRSAAPVEQSRR